MWVQVTAEALEREGGSPAGRADSRAGGTPCSAQLRFRPPFGGGRERDGQGHGRASDVAGEGSVWPEKPRVGGEVHSGQNGGATSVLHQAGSWQTQQAEGSPAVPEPQKHRWQQGLWSNGERTEPGERVPRGAGFVAGGKGLALSSQCRGLKWSLPRGQQPLVPLSAAHAPSAGVARMPGEPTVRPGTRWLRPWSRAPSRVLLVTSAEASE